MQIFKQANERARECSEQTHTYITESKHHYSVHGFYKICTFVIQMQMHNDNTIPHTYTPNIVFLHENNITRMLKWEQF